MRKTRPLSSSELSSGLEVAGEISGTPDGTVTLPATAKLELAAQSPTMQLAPSPISCLASTWAISSLLSVSALRTATVTAGTPAAAARLPASRADLRAAAP